MRTEILKVLKDMNTEVDTEVQIRIRKFRILNLIEIFDDRIRARNERMPLKSLIEIRDYLKSIIKESSEVEDREP